MPKKFKSETKIKFEYLPKHDPLLPLAKWKTVKGGKKTKFLSEQIDSINYDNV